MPQRPITQLFASAALVSFVAVAFPAAAASAQQAGTTTVASADQPGSVGGAKDDVMSTVQDDRVATGGPMRLSPLTGIDDQAWASVGKPLHLPRKAH